MKDNVKKLKNQSSEYKEARGQEVKVFKEYAETFNRHPTLGPYNEVFTLDSSVPVVGMPGSTEVRKGELGEILESLLEEYGGETSAKVNQAGISRGEIETLFSNAYRIAKEVGYEDEELFDNLGVDYRSLSLRESPIKPEQDEATLPLKELPEVFDRAYKTLTNWLDAKNLSDYSIQDGRTHLFSKRSLESFVIRELEPSTHVSSFEIEEIYKRIAEKFGGKPRSLGKDATERDKDLVGSEKLRIIEEKLGKEKLGNLIEEKCSGQQKAYISRVVFEGDSQKDIAEEEGLTGDAVSYHVNKGADEIWESVKDELN